MNAIPTYLVYPYNAKSGGIDDKARYIYESVNFSDALQYLKERKESLCVFHMCEILCYYNTHYNCIVL